MDQFYTQRQVAAECWRNLAAILRDLGLGDGAFFLEPSAGDGAFYDLLPAGRRAGFDIDPRHPEVLKRDFLGDDGSLLKAPDSNLVVVGNPPFGKRGKLAVDFFCRAAQEADTIAFIVPVIFRKYFIHKQLPPDFRWISTMPLKRTSFRTIAGKDYSVNTEFQIWTRKVSKHCNFRLASPPPIHHRDFVMWQYNNTKEALKIFDKPCDFAVPCQGWQDYSRRETNTDNCERNKQWMLLKASNDIVLKRLHDEIDYGSLALRNTTSTPGFRKGDLVEEYMSKYGLLMLG